MFNFKGFEMDFVTKYYINFTMTFQFENKPFTNLINDLHVTICK